MRVLIFAAAVLLATGLHAHADEPKPVTGAPTAAPSQWVLTLRLPNAIWVPAVYREEDRCEKARKRASQVVKGLVCMELVSP